MKPLLSKSRVQRKPQNAFERISMVADTIEYEVDAAMAVR
jgi:hypothetical protein